MKSLGPCPALGVQATASNTENDSPECERGSGASPAGRATHPAGIGVWWRLPEAAGHRPQSQFLHEDPTLIPGHPHRYKDYREPPWSEHKYDISKDFWAVLAARLAFVIVFQVRGVPFPEGLRTGH